MGITCTKMCQNEAAKEMFPPFSPIDGEIDRSDESDGKIADDGVGSCHRDATTKDAGHYRCRGSRGGQYADHRCLGQCFVKLPQDEVDQRASAILNGQQDVMKSGQSDIAPTHPAIGDEKHERKQVGNSRREERELIVKSDPQNHRDGEQVFLDIFCISVSLVPGRM